MEALQEFVPQGKGARTRKCIAEGRPISVIWVVEFHGNLDRTNLDRSVTLTKNMFDNESAWTIKKHVPWKL